MASRRKNENTTKNKLEAEIINSKFRRRLSKQKSASAPTNTVTDNRLELLITTVNRSKSEFYIDLLQSFDVNMQFVTPGRGTADEKMLALFGLNNSEKTVIFSVIQGNKLEEALAVLDEKFRTIKNGKGVAYTVPLSGLIGKLIFGFLSNNRNTVDNKEKDKV